MTNQPLSGNDSPRFADPSTFMRLPSASTSHELDAAILGVPFDIGTSHRPGARHGPRAIRTESRSIRPYNVVTRAAPFDSLQVADTGDVAINTYNLKKSISLIESHYDSVLESGTIPVSLGGDHTITLPILRALRKKHGPVGLLHVDAHSDCNDEMFGERVTHGTWLRRVVDEGLIDCSRVVQIGLRGSGYSAQDFDWCTDQGFTIVLASEIWGQDLTNRMSEVRALIGSGPVYFSFDIDGIDPAFAPGTGIAEVGGLTSFQALQIVRGCRGLSLIGADIVEVCPPLDPSHITSILAANLAFEMLCVLPGVQYRE